MEEVLQLRNNKEHLYRILYSDGRTDFFTQHQVRDLRNVRNQKKLKGMLNMSQMLEIPLNNIMLARTRTPRMSGA